MALSPQRQQPLLDGGQFGTHIGQRRALAILRRQWLRECQYQTQRRQRAFYHDPAPLWLTTVTARRFWA